MEDETIFVEPLAVEIPVVVVDTDETIFVRVYQSEEFVEDSNLNPNPDATNEATVEEPNANPNPNPHSTNDPTVEESNSNPNPNSKNEPTVEESNSNTNPNPHSTTEPVHEEPNTNSNPNSDSTTEPTLTQPNPIPTQLSQNCPTSNRFTRQGNTSNNSEAATNLSHLSTKKPSTKQKNP
ncbi:hypothetical protein RND81_07G064900 [Saponaria officinalis]|uniref:Uncharacterized protein n=1 Tax=Saponaria officinalis TaxID=3572 RepID=A0AAW1JKR1_SAPOF